MSSCRLLISCLECKYVIKKKNDVAICALFLNGGKFSNSHNKTFSSIPNTAFEARMDLNKCGPMANYFQKKENKTND